MYLDGWERKQYFRQYHDRVSRRRLTHPRVRRNRSGSCLERELRQVHLRQNQDDGEQGQFEDE